jgi:hypothetical protein
LPSEFWQTLGDANSNSLPKGFVILVFLAKEEKMSSNSLANWVDIFGKLAKMLAARASAPTRPAARLLILRMTCTCR